MSSDSHTRSRRRTDIFRGLAVNDGELVPLMDLDGLLGFESPSTEEDRVPRLVVVEASSSGGRWSMIVDMVHGVDMCDPGTWRIPSMSVSASITLFQVSMVQRTAGLRPTLASGGGCVSMSGDLSGFSMFDLFKEEARTHGAAISRGLVQLEATPGDEELIASLMQAAHSLKGAARIVGIDLAVEVAHAMEDAMVAVQKGERVITANRIDQLLAAADLLAQLTELEESGIDDWTMANVAAADSIATDLRNAVNDSAIANGSSPVDMDPDEASRPPSPPDDGSVQVTSHRLDQIMRLAGESLIASRRFQSVRNQLMQIRRRHGQMQSRLSEARIRDADSSEAALESARKEASRTELELAEHQDQLEIFLGRLEVVADSLYDEVLGSRMRPFDEGIAMFPRLVRDLSRSLGKKATLHIEGADVPVDRDVLRELEAPHTC